MALIAVAITIALQACSSDDESETPLVPKILTPGTDHRPLN